MILMVKHANDVGEVFANYTQLFWRLRTVCSIAPYAWQFVVATMHPERSPAVLVVVLFWKEMEISVCEGFGSKSEAVETSKNQQHNQYGGARGYRFVVKAAFRQR